MLFMTPFTTLSSVAHDRHQGSDSHLRQRSHHEVSRSERRLIRLATQSETVVYSIKIGSEFEPISSEASLPGWIRSLSGQGHTATGGEIIDVSDSELAWRCARQPWSRGSSCAMRWVISPLMLSITMLSARSMSA